jgi:hypothetical protein
VNNRFAPSIQASISGIHFFVGAGSSHRFSGQADYDFPLGSTLLENFKSHVRSADSHQLPSEQRSWAIENFNKHKSIDDFLDVAYFLGYCDLVTLGKKFVHREIIGCEQKVARYFEDRSELLILPWIQSFLDFMTHGAVSFEEAYKKLKRLDENKNPAVNFATLNYDRLIEVSLINYFIQKYPKEKQKITESFQVEGNLVQHHHGSLGSLQERPFGDVKENPSPTLKFWFEYPDKPQNWPIMNALSNERNHGVFLGFGFHQSIATRFDFQGSKPKIYISDFGKELKDEIETFLSTHELDDPTITNGADCCMKLIQELINEFSEDSTTSSCIKGPSLNAPQS